MKGWTSFNSNQNNMLENAGWLGNEENVKSFVDEKGNFDVAIPLSMIMGFAEDYKKIIVNMKHELILTRSRSDLNAIIQEGTTTSGVTAYEDCEVKISKIEWLMPYVIASDKQKIQLLNFIGKDNPISMCFRSWEIFEYPLLPSTNKHVWTVKTSNQLEKPRFVILGLQTKRKAVRTANASRFDHCEISNVKLFLNSQYYPYNNMNLDIYNNQYAILYDMYANFQKSYYGRDPQPMLTKSMFIENEPLIVIDCSRQNESLKNAPVDVRLEFEAKKDFPANTSAYCLILHDRIVQYNPISGDVKKLV
ncbi:uncharacterized protein LOC116418177 [Nasonia vitripennis]|uniref:Double jelly roll-like domain-containing protein n=1 Tax=Nasonia vitripennis TaxID=7425 RepID=A0A7M7QQ16_NASVI|nr:uncharacterized protein LOC116418177 [Nasonia vitripennis]